jgi:NitT/TauT family transport system ATP-binding protein
MTQAKVVIDGVTKIYDTGMLALENVSLQLTDGCFTSLLGPSGCGKSTFLNMVAGFVVPTCGQILVDGKAVSGPGADRGMVFQEYALFPWRTAAENVAFGPMIRRRPRAEQRELAERFLALVGLAEHGEKYPLQLSGGMKQRVAIARALANGPSVLLMDEPFGAVDAQTRETLQEELLSIWQKDQKTVIFVTHSVAESIFLSNQIVLMGTNPGSIREVFEVDLAHPRDRTGESFVALERKINRLMREETSKLGVC